MDHNFRADKVLLQRRKARGTCNRGIDWESNLESQEKLWSITNEETWDRGNGRIVTPQSKTATESDITGRLHNDQVRVSHFILLLVLDGMLFLPQNLAKLGYERYAISKTTKRLIRQGIVDPSGNRFSESTMAVLRDYTSKEKRFVDPRGLADFVFNVYKMENWADQDIEKFVSKFGESLNKKKKFRDTSPEELALLKKFRNNSS